MKDPIKAILASLIAQRDDSQQKREASLAEAAEQKEMIVKLERAIKALEDGSSTAPDQPIVRSIVRELLKANETAMSAKQLEAAVGEKLKDDHGKSNVGLALRMDEVIDGKEVVIVDGHVRLASEFRKTPASAANLEASIKSASVPS